jgi:hypothetical protein
MPAIIYKNSLGQRVPSVTTVLAQWGIKTEPLKYWAWKQGQAGIPLNQKPEADVGTIAHQMIDASVKGKDSDFSKYSPALVDQARKCFGNFVEWRNRHSFKPIETEISLVSEQYQYGGTIDCIAQIDGKLSIADWKTGKDIYEDYIIQIVSYGYLWNETFPDYPLTGGYHLIRTGKEIAMFQHSWYGEFPNAWEVFLKLRELYDLAKEIKKLK